MKVKTIRSFFFGNKFYKPGLIRKVKAVTHCAIKDYPPYYIIRVAGKDWAIVKYGAIEL